MLCTFGKKKEAKMLIFNILTSITSDSVGIDPNIAELFCYVMETKYLR